MSSRTPHILSDRRPHTDPESELGPVMAADRAGSGRQEGDAGLCGVVDIGSNTTRLLVAGAEPEAGLLHKAMEQKAYTRIVRAIDGEGRISAQKAAEVAEVVGTQIGLARQLGARQIRVVATAAVRDARNGAEVAALIAERTESEVEILSEADEGRLAFIGATKALGHPVEGRIAVVDVGGGSTEIVIGSLAEGVTSVRSWRLGSGRLADRLIDRDPPAAFEIEVVRSVIEEGFEDAEAGGAGQAVAIGGSANAARRLIGAVVEPETLERAIRILAERRAEDVARSFEIDPRRVRVMLPGVLLLEKASELLGLPLTIGKGGLREGLALELLS